MSEPEITIDEFVAGQIARLEAFASAYKREAETDPTFFPERTEVDWCREVAAYERCIVLQEKLARLGK